ncbi:MAG: tRNA (N6-isopentenyl adenosine(37)-C2)-methylthiotransferase MiaB [Armatimonadota bacterium]
MRENRPAYMIETWGCQMNEDDSAQMANLLEQMGYRRTGDETEADIILLNTCSVRDKPEQKAKSRLGELRLIKLERPELLIGLCGCMAQRAGKELLRRMPYIDLIIGTACIHDLPELIARARQSGPIVAVDMPEEGSVARVPGEAPLKAFVPVMFGCDNYCAYCVVPYTRGHERSRPMDEVAAEVQGLAERGCREVTLVGQNVNSYDGGADFAGLLAELNEIPELARIRFTTSHPKDLSDRLIEAMATLPKVCEHLHLPLQAGNDEVLARMGRRYTLAHYMGLVEKLRECVPEIAITTDVMVGFPGETEEQFGRTLAAMESIRYDAAFMFAFNARPGTAAAGMDGQVDAATKRRRLNELIAAQNAITFEKTKADEGRVFEVLVEGRSEKRSEMSTGYTRKNKTVNFPGEAPVGSIVRARAVKAHPWGFTGEMLP